MLLWITINTQYCDCKAAFFSPVVIILQFHHFSIGTYRMLSSTPLHMVHSSVKHTLALHVLPSVQSVVCREHAVMHSQFLLFSLRLYCLVIEALKALWLLHCSCDLSDYAKHINIYFFTQGVAKLTALSVILHYT